MSGQKAGFLFKRISLIALAFLVLGIGLARIAEDWKSILDERLGTRSSEILTEKLGEEDILSSYAYQADYPDTESLIKAHKDLAIKMSAEGSVLLKNNDALPLARGAKVTLLGMRSEYSQYGGQIGSTAPAQQNVSLTQALTEEGFAVNPVIPRIYKHYGEIVTGQVPFFGRMMDVFGYRPGTLKNSFGVGSVVPTLGINEPSAAMLSEQNPNYADSFNEYADAAVVVIGRPSTEAADFFPGEAGMENEGARNILGLTTNEREIIRVASENFDRVIVLVNSDSAMEIDELKKNDKIDSILWIGALGNYGFRGVAKILNGSVNPSGRLSDVYASNSVSSPAMQNFGIFEFANTEDIESAGSTEYRANWYLVEAEGIYTGYKYYETRYNDVVEKRGSASSAAGTFDSKGGWNYADEVSYPFGYGLSYTSFEQRLENVVVANNKKKAAVTVTVKNNGNAAGKDVVQVYAQAPYIEGGVEKSSVQLMNFEKTSELRPGQEEKITVEIDLQYLASYDYQKAKTYILDAGTYYFAIGNSAHDALNNILAKQGYSRADGMDGDGRADKAYSWKWNSYDDHTFANSKAGVDVTNRLDDADLNHWLPGTVTYLSRQDWEKTWPVSYKDIVADSDMIHQLRNDTYEIRKDDDTSTIIWGMESDLSFADLKGAGFDDYRWEELLNSVKIEDAIKTIVLGQNIIYGMPSIGSFDVPTNDGPMGFHGTLSDRSKKGSLYFVGEEDPNAKYETRDMPTAVVIASTYNKRLARENGILFGNDSLFNGQSFLWAPGVNTHRTPYNGRNHEYFSEDPILSGMMASQMCQGALTKGLVLAPKHFAFNDQETNRAAVAPFMNEQRARETELRAFQIAFEEGALGTMTSFTRIGATYVNAHVGLMQNILGDEWGFRGYIITDMINGSRYMTLKESLMANVTLFDTSRANLLEAGGDWSYFTPAGIKGDAALQLKMKNSLHNLLYAVANSNAMNGITTSSRTVWRLTSWRMAYIALIVVSGLIFALSLGGYIGLAAKKKERRA